MPTGQSGCPKEMRRQLRLTGVEEDHGLQTDILLPLKLQLTETRGGCQQHVKDLHDALHTLALLPAEGQRRGGGVLKIKRQTEDVNLKSIISEQSMKRVRDTKKKRRHDMRTKDGREPAHHSQPAVNRKQIKCSAAATDFYSD